jgi:hypothetical protein
MNYHFKHQITHTDPSIANKVNFFADCFDYILKNYGKPTFPELENHKSVLRKIKFQLDNFSNYAPKYINHYFRNSYLTKKDPIIEQYYLKDWAGINSLKIKAANYDDNSTREELNFKLTAFINKLDQSLFENALSNVIRAITCEHPLEKHNHVNIFQYFTPIILSEFIFAGFSREELRKLFDRILSKDLEIDSRGLRTEAPLPKKLLNLKLRVKSEPQKFIDAVNHYLLNRTLKQQFEGIYHLYKNSAENKTYVFQLSNITANDPISLSYNNVLISNQLKKQYVKRGKTGSRYREFFNGKSKLFAEVTVKESDNDTGKINAISKINNALNFFNATLGQEATVKIEDYIIRGTEIDARSNDFKPPLKAELAKRFNESNPYLVLSRKKKTDLAGKFLSIDSIYFQALSEKRSELKLVHYWRFIESFFQENDYNAASIQDVTSLILSKNQNGILERLYFDLATVILDTAYWRSIRPITDKSKINKFLNIHDSEFNTLLHPGQTKNINFRRLIEVLNHPYITQRYSWLTNSSEETKEKELEHFYNNILKEAYEQRNFIEHCGIHLNHSVEKVLLTLPDIARALRWLIIMELKNNNNYKSFTEIIHKLAN